MERVLWKSTYCVPGAKLISGSLLPWAWVHVVRSLCSGARRHGFKFQLQLCDLEHSTSLSLGFLICEMAIEQPLPWQIM